MALDTAALRKPESNFPAIKDRIVTLIRIASGKISQANTVTEKREMLRSLTEDDTLVAVWTGQYRSDAFSVSGELLAGWKQELLG